MPSSKPFCRDSSASLGGRAAEPPPICCFQESSAWKRSWSTDLRALDLREEEAQACRQEYGFKVGLVAAAVELDVGASEEEDLAAGAEVKSAGACHRSEGRPRSVDLRSSGGGIKQVRYRRAKRWLQTFSAMALVPSEPSGRGGYPGPLEIEDVPARLPYRWMVGVVTAPERSEQVAPAVALSPAGPGPLTTGKGTGRRLILNGGASPDRRSGSPSLGAL